MASPYDDPVPRGFPVVVATLRIVVALQCWGAAAARLHAGEDFHLVEFLTTTAGLSQAWADTWLDRAAWGLAACGLLSLVRPCWPVLLPVTAWFAFVSSTGTLVTNQWVEPAEQAARFLTPLTLLLLDFWPPRLKFSLGRAVVAFFLLRLGAAATFIGHGLEALHQSRVGGSFVELITGSFQNVLQVAVTVDQAQSALGVIGGVDIGLGLGLLLVRSRSFALYMAFWGVLTAVSRALAYGPDAYHMVLIRAASGGAAFALFLYWLLAIREQPPIVRPAGS
jgi:hypothetical protein